MRWERLLKLWVTLGRFLGCGHYFFCCLSCWRIHHPRRQRLTILIHGVRRMAAVGAAHPTAVSRHCNSVWPPSAASVAPWEPIDSTSGGRAKAARPPYYGSYYAPGYGGFTS